MKTCGQVSSRGKPCARELGHTGRHFPATTEQARANRTAAVRQRYTDPEFRAKHAAAVRAAIKPRKFCRKGLHDLDDPANVYQGAKGRQCRPCQAEQRRQKREANLEAVRAYDRERYRGNRERVLTRVRDYQIANPDKVRDQHRARLYGLKPGEFAAMFAAQGGRCAVCWTDMPNGKGYWHVDHDHETKKVRGILCQKCNLGLGMFSDDLARVRAAATYLEDHSGPQA